ncbi:SDR family oxidoreductase [Paenibacillus sp. 1001270B_150601_E10]|uniref:SDR family oxidoreductase n=1 Tax=Paenibacillus sp. 1001270B_150601_E10 TaxID=2787079 RepID=UPI0018A03A38|nr:SDR family oxidoreductase [Paenibacillus sp. 1001270B_150601_E10]
MLRHKTVLITGANAGMGLASTIALAKQGAYVMMACRDQERGSMALERAKQESGSQKLELVQCDLGDLASIRRCADVVRKHHHKLDILLNNAGVVSLKRTETKDGFESMMGVNHLGHFLLTQLLLPSLLLAEQGRIITVSSGAHKIGRFKAGDPFLTKGYSVWQGYANSKLANVLFTKQLAERLQGTRVTANCLHPGAVSTDIGVDRKSGFGRSVHRLLRPFFLTPAEGADTAIYLASSDEVTNVSGEYFYRRKPASTSKLAKDAELANVFWDWSLKQTGWSEDE